MTWTIYLWDY